MASSGDWVDGLMGVHALARRMVELAKEMTMLGPGPVCAQTAAKVADFFSGVWAKHVREEDEVLAPALAGRDAAVDQALAQLARQHFTLEALVARVVTPCRRLSRDASALDAYRLQLEAAAEALEVSLHEHLAHEERVIFPALRKLVPTPALLDLGVNVARSSAPRF